ncbi:MAG TPA: hypothetical protein VFY89_01040 [Ktedonobacterales bacterium]
MARAWLHARAAEARALWLTLPLGEMVSPWREPEWSVGRPARPVGRALPAPLFLGVSEGLAVRRVSAPSDFTANVMARIRPLPCPGTTAGPFLLARRATAMRRRSVLFPLGLFLAVAGSLALLLGGTAALVILNPDAALLFLGILVSLVVVVLASLHSVVLVGSEVVANAWLSVPVLVCLLGAALIAGPQLFRYLGPLISET